MCSSDFFCNGSSDILCFFYYFCDEFGGVVVDSKAPVGRTDNPVKRLMILLVFDGKQCSLVSSGLFSRFWHVLVVAGRCGGANHHRREQEPYSTRRLHIFILRAIQEMTNSLKMKNSLSRRLKSAIVRGAEPFR